MELEGDGDTNRSWSTWKDLEKKLDELGWGI